VRRRRGSRAPSSRSPRSRAPVTASPRRHRAVATAGAGRHHPHGYVLPAHVSWNGSDWQLDSGTFGGSLFGAAQLTDHDLLDHLAPLSGRLRMRLKNELPETSTPMPSRFASSTIRPARAWCPPPRKSFSRFATPSPRSPPRTCAAPSRSKESPGETTRSWTSDLSHRSADREEDASRRPRAPPSRSRPARESQAVGSRRGTRPWASDMLLYLLSQLGPRPCLVRRERTPTQRHGARSPRS